MDEIVVVERHIEVTQDDIDRGKPGIRSYLTNPIARAIARNTGASYTVVQDTHGSGTVNGIRFTFILDDEARCWLSDFENKLPVKPFTFPFKAVRYVYTSSDLSINGPRPQGTQYASAPHGGSLMVVNPTTNYDSSRNFFTPKPAEPTWIPPKIGRPSPKKETE